MKAEVIKIDDGPKPGGWYSQGFKVGNLIYTAGITAVGPNTNKLVAPGDISEQTRQILRNIKLILERSGSDLSHIFKTMVFVADIDKFEEFNSAYEEFFPENPPARSTMQIGKFNGGMEIEIEAIATIIE